VIRSESSPASTAVHRTYTRWPGAREARILAHVFDFDPAPIGSMSPFERGLSAVLDPLPDDWPLHLVDALDAELRWSRRWVVEPGAATHRGDAGDELDRLLAAGAAPLERAAAASREIARLTAEVATSLAEFARCRPAALFDRQPGERGAMSAATRAARPAALTEVSEWAVDEVAPTLRITATAATAQLVESLVLTERLPRTLALLARGELTPAHARQMVNLVGPVEDGDLRADIEAHVLGLSAGKTPPQLGDCARRIVLRRDADAAGRKLVAAVRERGVRFLDRRDGTAAVAIDLPLPTAAAIYRALEAYAEQARADGDQRTKQQRMADCLSDLVLRPGESGLPPVTIALTLVATLETLLGGGEPGQVDGHLVPAGMVRELGYAFGLMPRPTPDLGELRDPAGDPPEPPADAGPAEPTSRSEPASDARSAGPTSRSEPSTAAGSAGPTSRSEPPAEAGSAGPTGRAAPPAGARPAAAPAPEPGPVSDRSLSGWLALVAARDAEAVGAGLSGTRQAVLDGVWTDGDLRAVLDVGALLGVRDLAGTALAHRPHVAIVDKLRGSLVALTDATGIRRGQALGPPPETDGYTPGAELDRFVRLRDRRCRFPGCRGRARSCDLDHRREWPDGPTAHHNLCCLCEHHHRLKHQAPGWRLTEADADGLAVTTPTGHTLVSHPPRFGTDLDLPPY
jgi:Domain of unknown function (DUF222)